MNINDITITSLETINAFDIATGAFKFTLDELQNATIAQTQEKTDITGKQGRPHTWFYQPRRPEKKPAADRTKAPNK